MSFQSGSLETDDDVEAGDEAGSGDGGIKEITDVIYNDSGSGDDDYGSGSHDNR